MKMDTGQVKRTVGGVNRDALKYSHDAHFSMEDIIHSMKEHLLDQHAYANPGSSTGTESHHHDMRFPNMKSNKENVDPTFRKQEEQTGLPREERFSSSKVQSKVPPLSLVDPGEDTETEIELNTSRLNNPLFQKLKKKYPRAFRRRSSAFSDTSSVCSLSLPGTPRTPRSLSFPPQAQDNEDYQVINSEETQNSTVDYTIDNKGFKHSIEDLTTSGFTPLRNTTTNSGHSFTEDLTMFSSGIGRSRTYTVTPKGKEEKHEPEKDSKLSLKERLHRNKKNLRELLNEKYPFKNRSLSVFSAATDCVNSRQDEKPNISSTKTKNSSANHVPSYYASKPPKPTHPLATSKRLTNGNLSLHDIEHKTGADPLRHGRAMQKRSVADQFDQNHLYSKRFSSPDSGGSTHDSAVDVDSASLQSSPSSSDHNHSPDQQATTQRTSRANTPTHHSLPPRPVRYAPKLKSRRSAQQSPETEQLFLHNRDSDTDSGIGAHSYHVPNHRVHNDSGSSMDNDSEVHVGMFSGRKLSPESNQNLKISGNRAYSSNNNSPRQGPVKADHTIHTPSPIHKCRRDEADEEVEMWYRQGARPKIQTESTRRAASVADLTRRRDSPRGVHFNDDIDYSDELQPWHRTVSQPDLVHNGAGRFQFSVSPENGSHNEYQGASFGPNSDVDLHGPGRPYSAQKDKNSSERVFQDYHNESDVAWDNTSQSNYSTASGPELAHEIGYYSKLYEDINSTGKTKKSKRLWKRNKAKFKPSDDDEKVFSNLVKARSVSNIVQSTEYLNRPERGASSDLYENIPSLPGHDDTYENIPSLDKYDHADENLYEEMPHIKKKIPPSKPPRPQKTPDHGNNLYASVDKRNLDAKRKMYSSNPCVVQQIDESINVVEGPPVPVRGYTSDLERYKDLSGSRSSLSERVGSMKKSAKKGLSKLRRAISLEKVDNPEDNDGQGQLKKSSSIQSLKEKIPFRRKSSDNNNTKQRPSSAKTRPPRPSSGNKISKKHSSSMTTLHSVDSPTHFRPIGKLLNLNPDGTQALELNKPPHGPFGFYIARGNVKYNHGIFISRLSDSLPASFFASLLGVGDEILEINQREVRSLTMEQIHDMMASTNRLILKTLPFLARKDV